MAERTFIVAVESGDEVNVDEAMEKAMLVLSDRVWADCSVRKPWGIDVWETTPKLVHRDDLSYSFTPESEED